MKDKDMEKVNLLKKMALFIKDNSKMEKEVVKEKYSMKINLNLKVLSN
jgi:hypothetical protein